MPHLQEIRDIGSPLGKTLDSSVTSTNNSNWNTKENLKPEKKSKSKSTNQEPGSGGGGLDELEDEWNEFINVPANNTIDSNNTRGGIQESGRNAQPENILKDIKSELEEEDKGLPDGIQDFTAWKQENNHSTFQPLVSFSPISSAFTPALNGPNNPNDLVPALKNHPGFTATATGFSIIGMGTILFFLGKLGIKLWDCCKPLLSNTEPDHNDPEIIEFSTRTHNQSKNGQDYMAVATEEQIVKFRQEMKRYGAPLELVDEQQPAQPVDATPPSSTFRTVFLSDSASAGAGCSGTVNNQSDTIEPIKVLGDFNSQIIESIDP